MQVRGKKRLNRAYTLKTIDRREIEYASSSHDTNEFEWVALEYYFLLIFMELHFPSEAVCLNSITPFHTPFPLPLPLSLSLKLRQSLLYDFVVTHRVCQFLSVALQAYSSYHILANETPTF